MKPPNYFPNLRYLHDEIIGVRCANCDAIFAYHGRLDVHLTRADDSGCRPEVGEEDDSDGPKFTDEFRLRLSRLKVFRKRRAARRCRPRPQPPRCRSGGPAWVRMSNVQRPPAAADIGSEVLEHARTARGTERSVDTSFEPSFKRFGNCGSRRTSISGSLIAPLSAHFQA